MSTPEVKQLVENVFEVFAVEHWARFYHAVEKDGAIHIEIPEETLAEVEADSPVLAAFLKEINHKATDPAASQRQVGEYVFRVYEVSVDAKGRLSRLLDSPDFLIVMRLFSLWLSGHEGLLDQNAYAFADWRKMFADWRQNEKVQQFAATLSRPETAQDPGGKSVH